MIKSGVENNRLIEQIKKLTEIPDELNYFKKLFSPKTIKRGEFFIKAGETPEFIGFNLFGVLRHFYLKNQAQNLPSISVLRTPSLFHMAPISKTNHPYFI